MAIKILSKLFTHPDLCNYVDKGVRRMQMKVELSHVVTGSVADRKVITITDIICFCLS